MKQMVMMIVLACSTAAVNAEFMMPTDVPVDRLVKNATAYVSEHPADANGHYVLGRIHYLAWSIKTGLVPVWRDVAKSDDLPEVVSDTFAQGNVYRSQWNEAQRRAKEEMRVDDVSKLPKAESEAYWKRAQEIQQQLQKENWKPTALSDTQLDAHARQAVKSFQKAIELKPGEGLYHLGLASLCEQYADRAAVLKWGFGDRTEPVDAVEAKMSWLGQAMKDYRQAFELTATVDAKVKHQPVSGISSLVSYEAGKGYLRVAKAMEDRGADQKLMDRMANHVQKIEKLPIGAITPIVFSLRPVDSLATLIDESASVAFDLDGTGRAQRWTWVKPEGETAILVWDPTGEGRITSGRQLFGSVTWWLLPGDGYRALDLLDEDRDGQLTGAELRGLAGWFDRNGNGVSEAGEVVGLDRLPIAGIGVRATSWEGKTMMNPTGLHLTDGTVRATWDWVAERR